VTYGNAHADYSEFLADASSFANTSGGDLVLGVEAPKGIPIAIKPLTISMDQEILRLEQVVRGGLQPRLSNIAFHPVPIKAGGNVLIFRIPRSYNPPHRIIRQGNNRFWARSSGGKYEPDVNELRLLFNAAPQLADRIRNFRLDRVAKLAADDGPVRLMGDGGLILHVVPLSAFDMAPSLPLSQIVQNYNSFAPIGSESASLARINFNGVLKTSNARQRATEQRAYLQLYRNGIVEAVTSRLITLSSEKPTIFALDDGLIQEIMRALKDLAFIGIEPPYAVLVSLIGVAGAQINFGRGQWLGDWGESFDQDQYHFDEVIFETVPSTKAECAAVIRPLLDQIANASGQAASPVFDDEGRYTHPRAQ